MLTEELPPHPGKQRKRGVEVILWAPFADALSHPMSLGTGMLAPSSGSVHASRHWVDEQSMQRRMLAVQHHWLSHRDPPTSG